MQLQKRIEIAPHNKAWQGFYVDEANRLRAELGDLILDCYHIGSTAIPNMPAKPIIDILLVCKNLDDIDQIAEKILVLGYSPLSRHTTPHRSFFSKYLSGDMSYHLHIREIGDPQIQRHINFKNYLISHPDDAKAYANLKNQLAKQHEYDRYKYTAGKEKLIQHLCAKAKKLPTWEKNTPHAGPGRQTPWSKEKIIKAIEANINLQATHFAQYIDSIELIRVPGFTLVNSNLADAEFNIVLDAHFASEQALTRIKEILHIIKAQPYPFIWIVSPYDTPINLQEYLEKFSITNPDVLHGLYYHLANLPSLKQDNTLVIKKVSNKKEFYDYASLDSINVIANEKYYLQVADVIDEADPFEYYIGYYDGKPLVRGALVFEAQVAGIYNLHSSKSDSTYAQVMLHYLLERARSLGFHVATTLAAIEDDRINYQATGFQFAGSFFKYTIR